MTEASIIALGGALRTPNDNRSEPDPSRLAVVTKKIHETFLSYLLAAVPPWAWENNSENNRKLKVVLLSFEDRAKRLEESDSKARDSLFEEIRQTTPSLTGLFVYIAMEHKTLDSVFATIPPLNLLQHYQKRRALTLIEEHTKKAEFALLC